MLASLQNGVFSTNLRTKVSLFFFFFSTGQTLQQLSHIPRIFLDKFHNLTAVECRLRNFSVNERLSNHDRTRRNSNTSRTRFPRNTCFSFDSRLTNTFPGMIMKSMFVLWRHDFFYSSTYLLRLPDSPQSLSPKFQLFK